MTRVLIALFVTFTSISSLNGDLIIVSRKEWGARPPKEWVPTAPATLVVIHHTYMPGACQGRKNCSEAMRETQDFHMDSHGWSDFAYHYAIGGDAVYEGRGWEVLGAHAKNYNNHSLGIVFIGDYRVDVPSPSMLEMCQVLIGYGVANRHIQPDYHLVGHGQVGSTECPGEALLAVVRGWPHWVPHPSGTTGNNTDNNSAGKLVTNSLLLRMILVTMFVEIYIKHFN